MPTVPGAGRSLPRVETLPLPGGMRPAISSRSVVLPAAVGPATAETLPKGTSSETSANASRANGLPVLYSRHTRSKTTAAVFSAVKLPHSFHHSAHHCLKFAFSQRRGVPTHQITPKDLPQLLRHPNPHLLPGHAQILKPKSYVVLHAGTDYLILGILEKESHPRVNIKAQGRVCSGEPLDANLTLTWNQQTIGQSGQSALT